MKAVACVVMNRVKSSKFPNTVSGVIYQKNQFAPVNDGHLALILERAEIYLVSEMDPELVTDIFMKPYSTVQQALDDALAKQGPDAKVMLMPYGGSTLPMPEQQETER